MFIVAPPDKGGRGGMKTSEIDIGYLKDRTYNRKSSEIYEYKSSGYTSIKAQGIGV